MKRDLASGRFALRDGRSSDGRAAWVALWERWPVREVFAHPAYVDLFAGPEDRVLCASLEVENGACLYPFIARDLSRETYCPAGMRAVDLTTAYGYGGAFCWGTLGARALGEQFWPRFDAWAAEWGVVSEFVRFSLFPETRLEHPGESEEKQQNIVRDLALPLDEMWMDFEHKVRKNVNKARRSGITVQLDARAERLDEFLAIYESTMDRRNAAHGYYFKRDLFEKLAERLPGQHVYFHALLGGRVVSTELVLVSAENVYSFLGGTYAEAYDARPNDLLKHTVIEWAQSEGKRRFILGGGYQANDGIFRYKRSFAPRGAAPFLVGKRILDEDRYAQLIASRAGKARDSGQEWAPAQGFFPAYRA